MVEQNVGGNDRTVRALAAVVLAVIAVSAFRKQKRKTGLLVGLAALGAGFNAVTCFCGLNAALGIDSTEE